MPLPYMEAKHLSAQIQEILVGALAAQFGHLPKIELPGDDSRLLECAEAVLHHVREKGLYRRDSVVVVIFQEKQRLEMMTAEAFRTWVEKHITFFKVRHMKNGEPYEVLRTIPHEGASGILASWAFWPNLHEIEQCHYVSLPVWLGEDGTLLPEGYAKEHKTLTFKF